MSGNSKQDKKKAERRARDMATVIEVAPGWVRPPDGECAPEDTLTITPAGAPETERVKIRLVNLLGTDELVEFAVIGQTLHKGKWRTVAEVDSAHGDEVHMHVSGRSVDDRIGDARHLMPVACLADVADGYACAYEEIVVNWDRNKRRWHDA